MSDRKPQKLNGNLIGIIPRWRGCPKDGGGKVKRKSIFGLYQWYYNYSWKKCWYSV